MAHADLVPALKQRRAELTQELAHVDGLLALYDVAGPTGGTADQPQRGGLFVSNPNSKTSRVLAATRKMLEDAPGFELPFLTIYNSLPKDLVGTARHRREHIRGIIQKGDRVGIVYDSAERVRLNRKSELE